MKRKMKRRSAQPQSEPHSYQTYRRYVRRRIANLTPIFARASVGDFSRNIRIPDKDDEFTELYAGVQIMVEVIREQLRHLHQDLRLEKEREQRMNLEKVQREALIESLGDGIIATDRQGKTILLNQTAQQLVGLPATGVVGLPWLAHERLQDAQGKTVPIAKRPLQRALKRGQKVTGRFAFRRPDGSSIPVSITATPIFLNRRIIGGVKVIHDITKELEIDQAKDEFVALASHQLRTPLSAINWYTEMLLHQDVGPITPQQYKYLDQIYHGNQRMVDLVNALLNVSRIELGKLNIEPQTIDLIKLAENVTGEFIVDIQAQHLHVQKNFNRQLPRLQIDPQLMRVVLQNILSNAVKYTPSNGKITIKIDWYRDKSKPAIKQKPSEVLIAISDTGYGIPKKQQAKIFTKLFRADNVRTRETTGTGLGLYIAKAAIERSGGRIWFESEENKGTTFYIVIPLSGMKQQSGTRGLVLQTT